MGRPDRALLPRPHTRVRDPPGSLVRGAPRRRRGGAAGGRPGSWRRPRTSSSRPVACRRCSASCSGTARPPQPIDVGVGPRRRPLLPAVRGRVTLRAMVEPPTGAVTFLFTDIEGSTRLVKQLRANYSGVLADHQRLLREAFDAHRGYEVDTQGDSFFVAFASARDALLAAVEGQRELVSHDWPGGVQIRVRMGLHTGQAVAANGRYTGLAVHRAARIGAAGTAGRSSSPRRRRPCSRTRRRTCTSSSGTSASSTSRTWTTQSGSTRRLRIVCRRPFRPSGATPRPRRPQVLRPHAPSGGDGRLWRLRPSWRSRLRSR